MPQGLGRGLATTIGNAVGAGDAGRAAHAARVGLLLSLGCTTTLVASVISLRKPLVAAFDAPADVGEILVTMLPYCAVFIFGDGLQMALTGVITGAGRQARRAASNQRATDATCLGLAWLGLAWLDWH